MKIGELVFQLKQGKEFQREVRILDEKGNEYEPTLVEVDDVTDIAYIKVEECTFLLTQVPRLVM